jgi:C1A family cysteine protease
MRRRLAVTPHRSMAWYGWLPDLPDHRDQRYQLRRLARRALPRSVDLRAGCTAVEDQGALGSCTANALVGALEFLEIKDRLPPTDLSRLFIYYNERAIEGTVRQDSGAMLRDGIKSLAHLGVCDERRWPYVISRFAVRPSAACFARALQHRITAYSRLQTLTDMRNCLASGFPFVFGFTVYESFESTAVAKSGKVNLPARGEAVLGGHAVCAVGYDDAAKRFICRNSWGAGWGMRGYFSMPYAYLENRDLSDDFWTVQRGEHL